MGKNLWLIPKRRCSHVSVFFLGLVIVFCHCQLEGPNWEAVVDWKVLFIGQPPSRLYNYIKKLMLNITKQIRIPKPTTYTYLWSSCTRWSSLHFSLLNNNMNVSKQNWRVDWERIAYKWSLRDVSRTRSPIVMTWWWLTFVELDIIMTHFRCPFGASVDATC